MISKDRQYRAFNFEQKEDMIIEGQAVAFESPTVLFEMDGVEYKEVIDRAAFDEAHMSDVVLVVNHTGTPAARTKNGSLELRKTESGLFVRADLSRSSVGPDLHRDIKEGVFDKMSFAFTIRESSYDKATRTNRILKIDRLYDVSAVTFPAYEQTSISARSLFEAEAEKERAEARGLELKRKRIALMLALSGKDSDEPEGN